MWKLRALCAPLAAVALLVSAAPSASLAAGSLPIDSTLKLHPLLRAGAGFNVTAPVQVIVQTGRADPSLANQIASKVLGASVVEQFKVLPGFVLSVPRGALSTLAADPNVRYVSPDGPVQVLPQQGPIARTNVSRPTPVNSVDKNKSDISPANLLTTYPFDVNAPAAWSGAASWDGRGMTGANVAVAVIDSGVDATHPDLSDHVIAVNVNKHTNNASDGYGHGTHVAGIIAGDDAAGRYLGVAPNATVISVKVTDDNGNALESDLLRGLDWVNQNRTVYRIGAVNLSVTTSMPESYATSPVDAAVEFLVHQNVTVVAAAGNLGDARDAVWYAPANDPLAITVGCLDDNQTRLGSDDSLCSISSRGRTEDGFAKPDVVAPGRKIVSALASGINGQNVTLGQEFPDRITADGMHIRLSGTSMSAPIVTGAVALLLERQPGLHPQQIRQILSGTAARYPGQADGAGEINLATAIPATQHPPTYIPDQLPLPVGAASLPSGARTLLWDGATWASAYWDSAHWESAHWDSAQWDSAYWDTAHWDSAQWDSAQWDSAHWESAYWDSAHWDSAHWDSAHWDSAHWDSANYD